MGEVIEKTDYLRFSISRLAAEFGMSRETVAGRIAQAGVQPDGKRKGYPVYRLRDAAPVLVGSTLATVGPDGAIDPEDMDPLSRRHWYAGCKDRADAQLKEIALREREGELIPSADIRYGVAAALKALTLTLRTLPDVGERDAVLDPRQVEWLAKVTDQMGHELYQALVRIANDLDEEQGEPADG